jgi:hypothetical protein
VLLWAHWEFCWLLLSSTSHGISVKKPWHAAISAAWHGNKTNQNRRMPSFSYDVVNVCCYKKLRLDLLSRIWIEVVHRATRDLQKAHSHLSITSKARRYITEGTRRVSLNNRWNQSGYIEKSLRRHFGSLFFFLFFFHSNSSKSPSIQMFVDFLSFNDV